MDRRRLTIEAIMLYQELDRKIYLAGSDERAMELLRIKDRAHRRMLRRMKRTGWTVERR